MEEIGKVIPNNYILLLIIMLRQVEARDHKAEKMASIFYKEILIRAS